MKICSHVCLQILSPKGHIKPQVASKSFDPLNSMQWSVDVDDLLFWMFEYKCCIHLKWSGYLVSISFYCVYLNVAKVTHWDFNTRIFIQDLHYQLLVLIAAREAKLKLKFPETSKAATSANLKISISIFKLMRERILTISAREEKKMLENFFNHIWSIWRDSYVSGKYWSLLSAFDIRRGKFPSLLILQKVA